MALTDKELAVLHLRVQEEIWNIGNEDDCAEADTALDSLIAALRASRSEVEPLRKMCKDTAQTLAEVEGENDRLEAKIAVLEARLASAERMRAASFDRAERLEREA